MIGPHVGSGGSTSAARLHRLRVSLFQLAPGRILASGLASGLLLVMVLLLQQAALGRSPFGEPGDWADVWVAIIHCMLMGYMPAAFLAALAGARDVSRSTPSSEATARHARIVRGSVVWVAGSIGAFLGFMGPWLTEPHRGSPLAFWNAAEWPPEVFWHRLGGLWILVWFAWYAAVVVRIARRLADQAAEEPADLLDPSPFRPYLRQGLLQSLIAAGGLAFIGLLGLDEGITWMLLVFGGGGLALVLAAGLLPLLGVRGRLAAVKHAELGWCDSEIALERIRLREPEHSSTGRMADLAAYRSAVRQVSPWVLDSPAIRRFFLYLLIPLLSWIASALVQEFVQRGLPGR